MALAPPIHFSKVCPGVYRSGFPTPHNLSFLEGLKLRTVISLELSSYVDSVASWLEERHITVVHCTIAKCSEPFVVPEPAEIRRAIRILLDPAAQPVLVHCLRGRSRVGVVIGCLRRLQRWSLTAIFEEYRRFAGTAGTLLDHQVIELHDPDAEDDTADGADADTVPADVHAGAVGAGADVPPSVDFVQPPQST